MATKYDEAAYLNDDNNYESLTLSNAIESIINDEKNYIEKHTLKLWKI